MPKIGLWTLERHDFHNKILLIFMILPYFIKWWISQLSLIIFEQTFFPLIQYEKEKQFMCIKGIILLEKNIFMMSNIQKTSLKIMIFWGKLLETVEDLF